jgi:hypothetical protein
MPNWVSRVSSAVCIVLLGIGITALWRRTDNISEEIGRIPADWKSFRRSTR